MLITSDLAPMHYATPKKAGVWWMKDLKIVDARAPLEFFSPLGLGFNY